MIDSLTALQRWYESRCDGVWEHAHGIRIATLDKRDESDWVSVRATETEFAGYSGPRNLSELLVLAVDWSRDGDNVKASNDNGRGV